MCKKIMFSFRAFTDRVGHTVHSNTASHVCLTLANTKQFFCAIFSELFWNTTRICMHLFIIYNIFFLLLISAETET